jgi:hypothetical protein
MAESTAPSDKTVSHPDEVEAPKFVDATGVAKETTGHKLQEARIAVIQAELADPDFDKDLKVILKQELESYGIRSTAALKKATETA